MLVRCRSSSARVLYQSLRRVTMFTALACATTVTVVHADPPAPVDFRSEVVAIVPDTGAFQATVVGGDSFLELRVRTGVALEVRGYQGEPFLRFDADGSVEENRASPTFFVNRSRHGASVPDGITADTPPQWVLVATDGSYAWHDHRTHWMGMDDPPGHQRGDQILENTIPVLVDGTSTVDVVVRSFWEPAPSPVPTIVGVALGAGLAAALMQWRRRRVLLGSGTCLAAAALMVALAERASLPAETAPPISAWSLPAIALAAVAMSAIVGRRASGLVHAGLLTLAGVNLTLWAWSRRAALTKAVLPTDLAWWLERLVTATVLLAAPFLVVAALQPVAVAWRRAGRDPATRPTASTL